MSAATPSGQPTRLGDFTDLAERCHEVGADLSAFLAAPPVAALRWPDDVAEQWLYDDAGHGPFLHDYEHVDLARLSWSLQTLPAQLLAALGTGPSDGDAIEQYAADPDYWLGKRKQLYIDAWREQGTWLRAPLLIDRTLLTPMGDGLQVIEGRTRVGLLRGRMRQGQHVARRHQVWLASAHV